MDEEERNYCSIALLLLRVGNPCLRHYFKTQWDAAVKYSVPWTDCAQNGADLLRMFKPLQYEKNTVKSGDTSQWDLSLFVKALLYSRPPFVVAPNLVTALETLKEMRNKLCHSPSPRVEATEFQKSWIGGCNALSLFGATVVEFDKVKQDVQKPWIELLPMIIHCADQDQVIVEGLYSINSELKQLQQGQDTIVEGQSRLEQGQGRILKEFSSLRNVKWKTNEQPAAGLSSKAQEYTEKLKSSIRKETDFLLAEEEEKKVRTDDIFTNVTIERGEKQFQEPEAKKRKHVQPSRTTLKSCSEMFIRKEDDDNESTASGTTNPKSILLSGKAGIGKSLFCRKLVRDWSSDQLFEDNQENAKVPDFQFVFLLTFRQFSNPDQDEEDQKEKPMDLRDLLNRSSSLDEKSMVDEQLVQYVIENPEKLLIILDGFDEYKHHREKITGDFETRYPNGPHEKIPVPALIAKIIKGKMLKESVVIVSSRPEKAEELKKIIFDVRCDIQGFSSPQVLEYIGKYFKENESMKKQVLDHIQGNQILLSFSHIPVMCFLMCYYLEWYMTTKTTEKLPATNTELYYEVIKVFIKKHSSSKYEEMEETKVQEILHKLAELATNLTIEGKYIFDEQDMKTFNFNDEEITNLKASGLLDCCPGIKKSPFEKPPLEFTFTHLTIQEFMCAFSFVRRKQIPKKEETSEVTLEFVAGMLTKAKDEKLMDELIENIKPKDRNDKRNQLLTLSCLYEYKDDGFSTRIVKNFQHRYCNKDGEIEFRQLTAIDIVYLVYLLDIVYLINVEQQHRESFIVYTLHIRWSSNLTPSGIRMLCQSLVRLSTVTVLKLIGCKLDDECIKIISNVLSRTKLKELNLGGNNITDVGVESLCSVVKTGDCHVKVLYLWANDEITDGCKERVRNLVPDVTWIFVVP